MRYLVQTLDFVQIAGWGPILLAIILIAVTLLTLTIIIIRAAVKHNVPIETRAPLFNLRVGTTQSPKSPPKAATQNRQVPPIATELRKFRLARKIRQGDLAKLLNVKASFISRLEGGLEILTKDQLERIIVEYGLANPEAIKLRDVLARSKKVK